MNRPSSRHLSHDYEAYKGLSLRELFWIVIVITPLTSLIFSLGGVIIGYPLALGCVGFIIGFLLGITIFPKMIARIKKDKPPGYLVKKTFLVLTKWHLRKSPYLYHIGRWQKTKVVKGIDV